MFYFLDYDDGCRMDLTIAGQDYIDLIMTCFRYSSFFSLAFASEEIEQRVMSSISPFRRQVLYEGKYRRKFCCFYWCTDKAKQFLLTTATDLFEWIEFDDHNNPEDLVFYRDDDSVFFWSETHEGICALCNHAGEDVSVVTSKAGWRQYNKETGNIFGLPYDLCSLD